MQITDYEALSEHRTAVFRHDRIEHLAPAGTAHVPWYAEFPVSGDMLAVLKRGTPTQRRRRRKQARSTKW